MTAHALGEDIAVIGMGCTQFGDHWDRDATDLLVDAVHEALDSAGITLDDVDALWLGTAVSGMSGTMLSRALRIDDKPCSRVENYCATGSDAFRNACFGVAAKAYDVVLAVGVEKLKDSPYAGLFAAEPPGDGTSPDLTAPAAFDRLAASYSRRYGIPDSDLKDAMSHIAWKNHRNGALNDRAQFRREVPLRNIREAPSIAGRLSIYDCSGVADGGAAAVIMRASDAGTRRRLVVRGMSLVASSGRTTTEGGGDFSSLPEVVNSARNAYEQAGITDPRDQLRMAEVHDCFTPTELVLMEDLGFSERGHAWRDVLDGVFDCDGRLPVNTDGGLKSFGHPIGASGLRMLFECWLQLGNAAGERQIPGAERLALVQNLGGMPGECVSYVCVVEGDPG